MSAPFSDTWVPLGDNFRYFGRPWPALWLLLAPLGPQRRNLKKRPSWSLNTASFGEPFRHFSVKIEGVFRRLIAFRDLVAF